MASKLPDPDFLGYILKFDIVCLVETFLDKAFDLSRHFSDFQIFQKSARKLTSHGRRSGGVVVLVKKDISKLVYHVETEYDHILCLKLSKTLLNTEGDIIFMAAYVPPTTSPYYNTKQTKCHIDELECCLLDMFEKHGDLQVILCGDLNARTGQYQSNVCPVDEMDSADKRCDPYVCTRSSEDKVANQFGWELLSLCTSFSMHILNGNCTPDLSEHFTYVSVHGNSVIDYFVVSDELSSRSKRLAVDERVESSHMPLWFTFSVDCAHVRPPISEATQPPTKRLIWDREKEQEVKTLIQSESFVNKLAAATAMIKEDAEGSVELFTCALKDAAKPMERVFKNDSPLISENNKWFDSECRKLKRQTRKAFRMYKKEKTGQEKDRLKMLYLTERKSYSKVLKQKKDSHKQNRVNSLLLNISDSHAFWKEIKKFRRKRKPAGTIDNQAWYDHFKKVLNEDDDRRHVQEHDHTDTEEENELDCDILNSDITEEEVRTALSGLKKGKAAGPDGVLNDLLKTTGDTIVPYLLTLFNDLFRTGDYPSDWAKAIIQPIFKKGDDENPDNYRGVSLLSCVSKLYTSIMNARLTAWAEENNILSESQAGFRKNYSTIDHMFTLYAAVTKQLQLKKKLYVAFVDFQKAFDTVKRDVLWNVLLKIGVKGRMFNMLRSMYSSVLSCVRCNSGNTDYFECLQGLKQGCLASPTLFSFLINELASEIICKGRHGIQMLPGEIELFLLMFADDIALLSSSIVGLQNQLNILHNVSKRLGLRLNMNKTNVVVFRNGGHLAKSEKWFYGNAQVSSASSYKYLGLTFTTQARLNLSFNDAITRAKQGVIEIFKVLWNIGCHDMDIFFKLFDAQIAPILLYGSELWGCFDCSQIEKVHMYACKRLLGISSNSPNQMVYGELGRCTLSILANIRSVKYWLRLNCMPDSRYAKMSYIMLKNAVERGKQNWVSQVKCLLCMNGFGDVWLNGSVGRECAFIRTLQQRLQDCFEQNWHCKLDTSVRFDVYRMFKGELEKEKYLGVIENQYIRKMYTKFRLGITPLKVNKLRYNPECAESRNCTFCKSTEENENHFLFKCPAYNAIRQKYIGACFDLDQFSNSSLCILQTDNKLRLIALSNYVFYAFRQRENQL